VNAPAGFASQTKEKDVTTVQKITVTSEGINCPVPGTGFPGQALKNLHNRSGGGAGSTLPLVVAESL